MKFPFSCSEISSIKSFNGGNEQLQQNLTFIELHTKCQFVQLRAIHLLLAARKSKNCERKVLQEEFTEQELSRAMPKPAEKAPSKEQLQQGCSGRDGEV